MRLLIKVLAGIVIVIALLIGLVGAIGSRLPAEHTASRSIVLHQAPATVYATVRDFASWPTWYKEVKSVVVEKQSDGRVHFREKKKYEAINYELAEDVPAERIVTRILDQDLGYTGRWTYKFSPEGGGTRVSITEEGEVSNVIFRFASKYVFGYTETMDSYLKSLAHRFGEIAQPQ